MITWDTIRYVIETIWLINLALAFWTVFRERRDIASTWAWLLVLSFLPVSYTHLTLPTILLV